MCGHCFLFLLLLIVMFAADFIYSFVTAATPSSHCDVTAATPSSHCDIDDDGHVIEITMAYIILTLLLGAA